MTSELRATNVDLTYLESKITLEKIKVQKIEIDEIKLQKDSDLDAPFEAGV